MSKIRGCSLNSTKIMETSSVAILGGIGGSIALVVTLILMFRCFMSRCRKSSNNKDSETGSSDPSAVVEMKRARQFRMEELEQASRNFDENNLIGHGTFGLVFKGILTDGTIVAIKRRNGYARQDFTEEAVYLMAIYHRNLVTLLGYCQEGGSQMLVFEYVPNGSMSSHLYGTGKESIAKLEFKQRLSIAIGAAKGLCHLHSLQPPVLHGNFKTANVLVDENFIAKVADAGVSKLLAKIEDASSSGTSFNALRDPELEHSDTFHEMNDVYSFGVFLLELVAGKEVTEQEIFRSNDSILHWVQHHLSMNDLVDQRLVGNFTAEGMSDLLKLMIRCMSFPGRERPRMEIIVPELDQILENEVTRTTFMGEGMSTVTLGSQLFTS